ncbi:PadR family transcriptional regulator [Bailinhaonella thermotolerans]|uniref:PadR family transcriptional regulator n=1 Tax=Bailinhaonella thermotolerans TaxID=1070861 RepID=A0A3A4A803_9ACTN|nr:PadR family transcriptional regulator [Bailinhaonella thermotolerans]RJL25156.1 PadR family transcriptional regulator [Bailinhaonella thermotolerans]
MSPVFGHGRLRLYLLKLLDESPRHGYEVIRLLQDRFLGVYSPSPGTIYPRLARMEAEGLVTHEVEKGRKVFRLTDAGRAELRDRGDELADLEREVADSVSGITREIREDVRETVRSLREELTRVARDVRRGEESPLAAAEDIKREWRRHKEQWREDRDRWQHAWENVWSGGRRRDPRTELHVLLDEFAGEVHRLADEADVSRDSVREVRRALARAGAEIRRALDA